MSQTPSELDEDDDFAPYEMYKCQGFPRCPFNEKQAEFAFMMGGCIWCDRIFHYAHGREYKTGPGNA